jgi:4-O-beta-D-mannosyl-D-glucose phosphorylase
VRTKDFRNGKGSRSKTSPQQRNVVLHPEFINGKYAFLPGHRMVLLMRNGGGIGFGLSDTIECAKIEDESDRSKQYHTI